MTTDPTVEKINKAKASPEGKIITSANHLLGGVPAKGAQAVDRGVNHATTIATNLVKELKTASQGAVGGMKNTLEGIASSAGNLASYLRGK